MKKKKIKSKKQWIIIALFMLSSCSGKPHFSTNGLTNRLTREEEILVDFKNGENFLFREAWWSNGYPFDCRWSQDSINFEDDTMKVTLFKKDDTYFGGEYRSNLKTSYGFYSVKMKAISCPGVITSFFTYTHNPWDEIDIEFLGEDTTKVQFNYYTNGVGKHEYIYKLGFDASKDFHEYSFDWKKESITWYVDGVPVYRATKDIPKTDTYIMMNVWNVHSNVKEWAGEFDETKLPVTAEYKWVGYSPNN
jgi:endoglucanase